MNERRWRWAVWALQISQEVGVMRAVANELRNRMARHRRVAHGFDKLRIQ